MEWFRRERNPWGQEILIGLSWDLIWVAVVAGVLFILAHVVLYYWRWRAPAAGEARVSEVFLKDLPEKILRHSLASRIFHWVMAVSVLTLLLTGFLPILGVKFSWVTPHWIAGSFLTAAIIFHVVHATFWKGLGMMWIGRHDLRDGWRTIKQVLGTAEAPPAKPGKNPFENKIFHHAVTVSTLAATITGLVMMAKVDTPWWDRNPYVLPDDTWGWIYVLHGAGSVALITLIMAHFYFAARPEKLWITLSMFRGWISRDRYLEHHDPKRWPANPSGFRAADEKLAERGHEGRQPLGAP